MADHSSVDPDELQMMRTAAEAAGRLIGQLPSSAPSEWRTTAYEYLLDGILRDEYVLDDDDEVELQGLLHASAEVAMEQPFDLRNTAFTVLLRYNIETWLDLRGEE